MSPRCHATGSGGHAGALGETLERWLFGGVDPVRLDTFRRCLALTFLFYTASSFVHAGEWLTDAGFHYTSETERYGYPDPWPTMPDWAVPLFGVALFGSTLCLVMGRRVGLATWVVLGCAIYIQRVDSLTAFTLNKLYVVSFAVLACAPSPVATVGGDGESRELQSVWPIRVLQGTLLLQYFTAGMCKLVHGDWLWNRLGLWTQVQGVYRTSFAAMLLDRLPLVVWSTAMYGSLAFELLAPALFTIRVLVPIGILWGIAFQVGVALTMYKLIFFSAQLMCFYLLFLDAEKLRRIRWRARRPVRFKPRPAVSRS